MLLDFGADAFRKNDDDETPMSLSSSVRIHHMFGYEPPAAQRDPHAFDVHQPSMSTPKKQTAASLRHLGDEESERVASLPRRARNEYESVGNPHQLPGLPTRRRRSTYGGIPFHKAQPIYSRRFEHKSPLVVAGLQMSRADSNPHLCGLPAADPESVNSRRMSGYASGIEQQPASSKKKAMRVSSYGVNVQPDRKKESAAMRVSAYGLPLISARCERSLLCMSKLWIRSNTRPNGLRTDGSLDGVPGIIWEYSLQKRKDALPPVPSPPRGLRRTRFRLPRPPVEHSAVSMQLGTPMGALSTPDLPR